MQLNRRSSSAIIEQTPRCFSADHWRFTGLHSANFSSVCLTVPQGTTELWTYSMLILQQQPQPPLSSHLEDRLQPGVLNISVCPLSSKIACLWEVCVELEPGSLWSSDGCSTYPVVLDEFLWIFIQVHSQASEDAFSSYVNVVNLRMKFWKDVYTHHNIRIKINWQRQFL